MINILIEVTAYRDDGSHNSYVFDDESKYDDYLRLTSKLQKDERVVYMSTVTCTEWFKDE